MHPEATKCSLFSSMASPDSVPSLSELSSGTLDYSPDDGISRKLFHTPQKFQSKWGDAMANICCEPPSPTRSLDGSSQTSMDSLKIVISTSSEVATTRARHNLLEAVEGHSLKNDTSALTRHSMYSAPVKEFGTMEDYGPGCFTLRSTQMTPFVPMFDIPEYDDSYGPSRPKSTWPRMLGLPTDIVHVNAGPKNAETVEMSLDHWRGKTDSLEREIDALKEIIHLDAINTLKLKVNIDELKGAAQDHTANTFFPCQLRASNLEASKLGKFDDGHEDCQRQHKETINILKAEVDRLTTIQKNNKSKRINDEKLLNQLRFENDLLAIQIVENETLMKTMKENLHRKNAELVSLELKSQKMIEAALVEDLLSKELSIGTEGLNLKSKVENLTKMLDFVEQERLNMLANYAMELHLKDKEITEIKEMVRMVLTRQEEQSSCSHDVAAYIANKDEEIDKHVEKLRICDGEILELKKRIVGTNGIVNPDCSLAEVAITVGYSPFRMIKGCFGK